MLPRGKITGLQAGWGDTSMRIFLNFPMQNPDNCPHTNGYIVPSYAPYNQQFSSMAITAYAAKQNVVLVLEGCAEGYPKIVGFHVED